jgi:gamma-glutamyl-gamma-aminobutyrate hydrolase PuuD
MVYDHDNEELVKELQRERDDAVGALARLAAHYGPVLGLCGGLQASEYEECIKGYVGEVIE